MRKFFALLLAFAMVFSLAACGGKTEEPAAPATTEAPAAAPATTGAPAAAETTEAAEISVAMITDYGDITDQSFNQTTYEACKEYCEANSISFNYFKPASDSDDDRVAMIEKAIDEGFNVIVTPGYAFANALKATAGDNSDVKFVAIDVSAGDFGDDYTLPENLYSAVYQEELCGYMAGYAAVKLGYTKLGYLGGMAVPAVVRYGYGFLQGADAAAAELGVEVECNYAYGNQFFGDADITAAMDVWYQAGTECVFACGGGIFTSAAEAAAKVGGKVIGVDVDQAPTIDGLYGAGMTVTSAMKGLAPTTKAQLAAIVDGSFKGGQIETLGLISANPEENYVQIPASTQFADSFTADDYKALVADMFAGKITVSNDTTKAAADVVSTITVNDQGNIK